MECLDCQISEIPEGHSGLVFLECEDLPGKFYRGKYHLCSNCWRRRQKEILQREEDRRRKKIEEETRAPGKKKSGGARRGSNQFGSSH